MTCWASAIATPAIAVESVRMYVIRPTCPSGVSAPSYRRWATDIVRLGLKPSLRLASCWSVLVVNGGAGLRFDWRLPTESTTGFAARIAVAWRSAVSPSPMSTVLPSIRTRSAVNGVPSAVARSASSVQYSFALNARISRSRSTTIRTATDWTRPAERPPRTLRDRSGLSV